MRILYIANSNGMAEGSVIALLSIITEMRKQGHEVAAIFPDEGEALLKCQEMQVITYVSKFYNSIYPLYSTTKSHLAVPYKIVRNTIQNFITVKRIISIIRTFCPDVVHTNVGTVNVGYYAAKYCNVPHVWHIREMAEKNLGWHPLPCLSYKKRLYSKNSFNIAITNEVFSFYNLQENNSHVVYDGIFKNGVPPLVRLEKEKYFLFVGRICEGKGTAWAVDAFLRIKDSYPDYQLLIAGTGGNAYARNLKEKCRKEIAEGRILFLGFRRDVYALMQKATALIVPSELEGFGFITAEAMYNGCIVIGRNTGGTKEQFDNGKKQTGEEIGLRFETIDELADKMIEVCRKGVKSYENMLSKAQRTVMSLYTIEGNVRMILEIYERQLILSKNL